MSKTATILLIALCTTIFAYFNYENLPLNFSLVLGAIFAPYIFRKIRDTKSHRYIIFALLFGGLLCFRRSASLYYAFWCFCILYILESQWGRLNQLPLFLLAVVSAFANHIAYVWSFPIRLWLSSIVAKSLTFIGMDAQADGNIILLNGSDFNVEPGCVGLNMLLTGLVMGLFILAHFERQYQRTFNFLQVSAAMLFVLLLSVFSNYIRLLTLVIFYILPENPLHELVGIFCLMVYVLLPFYAIVARIVIRYFQSVPLNM